MFTCRTFKFKSIFYIERNCLAIGIIHLKPQLFHSYLCGYALHFINQDSADSPALHIFRGSYQRKVSRFAFLIIAVKCSKTDRIIACISRNNFCKFCKFISQFFNAISVQIREKRNKADYCLLNLCSTF